MTSERLLPETLPQAVRAEWARAWRPPFEVIGVVAGNGLLMVLAWFVLPRSWMFAFQGALAFPMFLASWMLADVTATNLLAPDRDRVLAALDGDPGALRRLLYAKNIVLWMLVAPLCTIIALAIGVHDSRWPTTMVTIVIIVIVPVALFAPAAVTGVLFPYHPHSLAWRWRSRRRFGAVVARWLILVTAPYWVVPALAGVMVLPSVLVWGALSHWRLSELTDDAFAAGAALACVVAAAGWFVGHRLLDTLARRRRAELTAYLSAPDRG